MLKVLAIVFVCLLGLFIISQIADIVIKFIRKKRSSSAPPDGDDKKSNKEE